MGLFSHGGEHGGIPESARNFRAPRSGNTTPEWAAASPEQAENLDAHKRLDGLLSDLAFSNQRGTPEVETLVNKINGLLRTRDNILGETVDFLEAQARTILGQVH